LDKIGKSGYESLSKEEKEILYRASQQKDWYATVNWEILFRIPFLSILDVNLYFENKHFDWLDVILTNNKLANYLCLQLQETFWKT
jgi:hypothetical protein